MCFSLSSTRAASSGNYFSWSHLLRRSLTNMDWAQNGAQFTSLSLRESITTLTEKLWARSPSTLYPYSSWRDPQNQPDWRVGINHFKNHYRQQGQRTCNRALQLQPVVAHIGTVLMRRKSYAISECGGSCCRVWLFHIQGTWDFQHLLFICSVFIIPLSLPSFCARRMIWSTRAQGYF